MSVSELLARERAGYEIVSLGVDCKVAHRLRAHGLRQTAFPFDWNIVPIASVIELLGNDFSGFLSPDNLLFLPPVERLLFDENGADMQMLNDIVTPVVCRRYRMLFPHDFSVAGEQDLAAVQDKYRRRIERLQEILHSGMPVIFVAHDRELNDWQKAQYEDGLGMPFSNPNSGPNSGWESALAATLDARFPGLDYRISELSAFEQAVAEVSSAGLSTKGSEGF